MCCWPGWRTGVARIVHTSTSEVYGTALQVPIDESHPLQGQSPYSASKIGADKIAESFYRSFDLPVVTLAPFQYVRTTSICQGGDPDDHHAGAHSGCSPPGQPGRPARPDLVADTVNGFLAVGQAPGSGRRNLQPGTGRGSERSASWQKRSSAWWADRLRSGLDESRLTPGEERGATPALR